MSDENSRTINTLNRFSKAARLAPSAAVAASLALVFSATAAGHDANDPAIPTRPIANLQPYADASGAVATFNTKGRIDPRNAFFQSLGTNGRSCGSCHVASQAFSITPPEIRQRYAQTQGRDPLFADVDGANCSGVKRSDRAGHSLLLSHGLIRIANPVPANAQFTISVVHDPYRCALVSDPSTGQMTASVYRRPLPTTNVAFLSAVMWDGRETITPLNNGQTFLANLQSDLAHQATSAINTHAQASTQPTSAQLTEIVNFELGLFTAQTWDRAAGSLDRHGAVGGPWNLSNVPYYPGINDSLGAEPTGAAFTATTMTSFSAWNRASPSSTDALDADPSGDRESGLRYLARYWRDRAASRQQIAAGEALFNSAPMTITTVRGLTDNATLGKPTSFQGTCGTCHDTPNVGHHSLPLPLDIGVGHSGLPSLESDPNIAAGLAELDEPNLPVFLINGCADPFNPGQPASFYTTDPGKALITGQCGDLNRLKGPVLRGLAARAPYFHNGAARTLLQAVNFYNQRFQMNLTEAQKGQLVAFLNSL